jgi:hypothetical protein
LNEALKVMMNRKKRRKNDTKKEINQILQGSRDERKTKDQTKMSKEFHNDRKSVREMRGL